MNKKYKKYPGMKMIKRATGSSKLESTMYKAGQTMIKILDKGLLSFIKKPELPKGMEQSVSKPLAIASQKPATPSKLPSTSKALVPTKNQLVTMDTAKKFKNMQKLAKVAKFARMATPVGVGLTVAASGLGTYEKGKDPQSLAKKAYEKGKEYKVADEFTVVGSEGTKKVKMKSKGGMIIGKQADYIKDLI